MKKWLIRILNGISIAFIIVVVLYVARVPIARSIVWIWQRIGHTRFEVQDASKVHRFKLAEESYDPNYSPGLMSVQVSGKLIGKAKIYVFPASDSISFYGQERTKYFPSVELDGKGKLSQFAEIDFYTGNHAFIVYIPEKGTKGELIIKAKL